MWVDSRYRSLVGSFTLQSAIGDIGITGANSGRCELLSRRAFAFPFLVGVARCSSLAAVSARGGGLGLSCVRPVIPAFVLSEEGTDRSSSTAVDPLELPPPRDGKPSKMRYSSSSACFSVQHPCQQFLQSQTKNWKQKVSTLRHGWKQIQRLL